MTKWKKIKLKDLTTLQEHSRKFLPYSHVNSLDIWIFRCKANYWYKFGDTIAYKLNDYVTGEYYITLLGKKDAKEVIRHICQQSSHSNSLLILRSVPHETVQALSEWDAIRSVHEDINSHDYIFEASAFINFSSQKLRKKWPLYKKLLAKHPDLETRILSPRVLKDRILMYNVFKLWVKQTNPPDWEKELKATKRAFRFKKRELVCLGVFDGKKLVGFTVNEPETNGYYQAIFGKADRKYVGLGLMLEHETAKYMLQNFGSKYMNLQCDLGLEGLRGYKRSLGPHGYLKKYNLVIDVHRALRIKQY